MAGSVVGGGGGGGGGGADALKPLIDALEKNSAAISSQSDKQGEAKLAKMMEDLSAALELMVSFITRLNDSIAGLKLGFSTLSGALNAAAKAQTSQKPVKPLTSKQQLAANSAQAKADAKVLAQDKNLAYKREKDDKANSIRQTNAAYRAEAKIVKQLKDEQKKADKPPQVMGPFLHEEQTAKNQLNAKQQERDDAGLADQFNATKAERIKAENDYIATEKKNNAKIESLRKESDDFIADSAKESADSLVDASKRRVAADMAQMAASDAAAKQADARAQSDQARNKKEYDDQLRSYQKAEESAYKSFDKMDASDAKKSEVDKAAEAKAASKSVLGVDLGAIGYKMEEFGKAATLAGAAMTAAGMPVGPLFTVVGTASKYLGTTLRWTATIAKGLISAFSWLRSTVSALAKSVAVYAPAISQMAEMALRDMSAVMGAAGVGVLKAFTPIVRSISDKMFPVNKDYSAASGAVVKSFGPMIEGLTNALMPTMTLLIQVFRALWYIIGPIIEILGQLVNIIGVFIAGMFSCVSIVIDWLMPAFVFLGECIQLAADGLAWLAKKLSFGFLSLGSVDEKDRLKNALDPASTVGLAAAQSAKMGSFQSLGESAAQTAFLASSGAGDPERDLAQAILDNNLPDKWKIFLDAQGKDIIPANRRDTDWIGGGGDYGPGMGDAVKPQWEGFG